MGDELAAGLPLKDSPGHLRTIFPDPHHLNPGHAPIVFLALSRAVSDNNSRQTPLVTGPPFRLLSLKFGGSLLCKDIRPHRKVSLVHAEK